MEISLESAIKVLLLLAVLNATIARATGESVSVLPAADSAPASSALLPPETESQLAAAREACGALGHVVETLEARGQGQYSRMSYEVVRHVLDAIENEDIPGGWTNRMVREARELAAMAPRALAKAKRIASGEDRDMPVPRFKSGPVVARGCIVHGRRQWPDGRVEEDSSVMLNGWGHFRDAPRDVGFLNRIGGNFLQQEVKFRDLEQERGVVRAEVLDELADTLRGSLLADTPVDFLLSSHYMPKWALEGDGENVGDIAEKYYSTVRAVLKEVLPNHLYLGSRIHFAPESVWLASARHCDVVSNNFYEHEPSYDLPAEAPDEMRSTFLQFNT